MKDKIRKCCICKKEFIGYGNNPAPFMYTNERCCDNCNRLYVIPRRKDDRYFQPINTNWYNETYHRLLDAIQ